MRKKLAVTAALLALVVLSGVAGAQIRQRFDDVPPGHYAEDAVEWAADIGVTTGCGDGTNFCPTEKLSRAHMVTFLKRYHDWFTSGTPSPPPDAPPKYATYEAAVTAADEWFQEMQRLAGGGDNEDDWHQITQQAADKALLWAGHDQSADRLAYEAGVFSRTLGDVVIEKRLGSLDAARFYTAAAGYALAAAASDAALGSTSERDAAAAAAWSAAGARLTELGHTAITTQPWVHCFDCVIGGYDRLVSRRSGSFHFGDSARAEATTARNHYFDQFS